MDIQINGRVSLNPNYQILENVLRLDCDAAVVTAEFRAAQKELAELQKKSKVSEDLIVKAKSEMSFAEGELRRAYKRADDIEERKSQRNQKLLAAKTDEEHKSLKREVDNLDKEARDLGRRLEETETRIEHYKALYFKSQEELVKVNDTSALEREKAKQAEDNSSAKLADLNAVRQTFLQKLDDRLYQHYSRLSKITRNPQGPVTRVVDRTCGNCHLGLAPQLLNSIAKASVVEFCPTCHHLLLPSHPHS